MSVYWYSYWYYWWLLIILMILMMMMMMMMMIQKSSEHSWAEPEVVSHPMIYITLMFRKIDIEGGCTAQKSCWGMRSTHSKHPFGALSKDTRVVKFGGPWTTMAQRGRSRCTQWVPWEISFGEGGEKGGNVMSTRWTWRCLENDISTKLVKGIKSRKYIQKWCLKKWPFKA